MKAYVWKAVYDEYYLQVENITQKSEKALEKVMENWRLVSYGFLANGKLIKIFKHSFADREAVEKWIHKNFAWGIEYVTNKGLGETRALKSKKGNKKRKLTCSKCGKTGHNSRTCASENKAMKKKTVRKSKTVRKRTVCGNCNEVGHNRRTCPKK